MARLEHPGKKSYWHLLAAARKPSEYAIRSGRLDYYRDGRFEVDAPLSHWFERHGAAHDLPGCDWERFDDPAAFTYASYVARRRDDELFAARLLDEPEPSSAPDRALLETWAHGLSPLRFVYHALQMSSAYVAHLAPASKISIAATFQAADELRRVQRVAYRLAQLERRSGQPLANAGRDAWLRDSTWQGVRALLETLLVSYDFSESLLALNAVVAPACDALFFRRLGAQLSVQGDSTSARLLEALQRDGEWHRAWSQALLALIVSSSTVAEARVDELTARWRPRVFEALCPLAEARFGLNAAEARELLANAISERGA